MIAFLASPGQYDKNYCIYTFVAGHWPLLAGFVTSCGFFPPQCSFLAPTLLHHSPLLNMHIDKGCPRIFRNRKQCCYVIVQKYSWTPFKLKKLASILLSPESHGLTNKFINHRESGCCLSAGGWGQITKINKKEKKTSESSK